MKGRGATLSQNSRNLIVAALSGAMLLSAAPAAAEVPAVVATVAPVHSLIAGVMAGVGTPTLLLPPSASPHTYAMKPSDAKALSEAAVVFWVGEGLETFLQRPLKVLATDARLVELAAVEGMTLLPVRAGGAFDAGDRDRVHPAASDEHDANEQTAHDPHLWLSPSNAQRIVAAAVATLGDLDPANADRYRRNAALLDDRLRDLTAELAEQLTPVRDQPYVVFHDAYQYLESSYDLRPVGSITLHPEQPPGAGRLAELRDKMVELGADCLFSEPQFKSDIVAALVAGLDARIAVLDPLGSEFPAGSDQYFETMRAMAQSITRCLSPNS